MQDFTLIMNIEDKEKAPSDWHMQALLGISRHIDQGFISGEVIVYDEDRSFRVWWRTELDAGQ